MTKQNIGPHAATANNQLTFFQAFAQASNNPTRQYATTGNSTPFTAEASVTSKGIHIGQQVIVFRSEGQERARAYPCCWGQQTNCNSTHINCYTEAM